MSRRRRYSDDEDEGRGNKRRRTSEPLEIEDRLESLITRVGEKSTSSLESNLEGLASVLEADLPNYKAKILKILVDCAVQLPEKLSVYTTLVGLLNARNYNFGGEVRSQKLNGVLNSGNSMQNTIAEDKTYLFLAVTISTCVNKL
ncbi:PREDICTED: nuclear cap-binding protein subunit 1-A-like [Branchiostoma belcheri]|uniref:Nuclear cap-binding protein subunit 1-A-like n=1 Tax=Branchiostoma belcheri TaxID=7741 RepID=A0A6P4XFV9_BRABE|nr:PREDICTED: nuclear cap-binding protein subunit 1-A-like [Branchiostoma belcheri]